MIAEISNLSSVSDLHRVENILDKVNTVKNILNPCYGDGSLRGFHSGYGFLSEKAFTGYNKPSVTEKGLFVKSGPRLHIAFDNKTSKAAIVTCGGLSPGLNVVIREITMTLWFGYKLREIYGIKFGYRGFYNEEWVSLDPKVVKDVHKEGGTFLGTSRGGFDKDKIVDALEKKGVNLVFVIGGDGTHRGILALSEEIDKRGLNIILAGIPKTIDNDIPLIDRSFGYESAVEEATKVIQSAKVEMNSTEYSVGIVKLFGRECGAISIGATLSQRDVNICLIPEAPFDLYGPLGLMKYVEVLLKRKKNALIVVAEGCAKSIRDLNIEETGQFDRSGNKVLPNVGVFIKDEIDKVAKELGFDVIFKYIDPTYMIRSVKANSFDTVFCA